MSSSSTLPGSSSSSSYVAAHTVWPTSVTVRPEVRRLLARFYHLLDIPDTSVGHRFADEVFAPDGVMFGMGPGFRGEAEIRTSREQAWTDYTSRRHEMLRVYAHDALGLDLLVIGRVEMGLRNSKKVTEEFVARFVVDEGTLGWSHEDDGNAKRTRPNEDTTRTGQDADEDGHGVDRVRLKLSRVWSNMEPIVAALRGESSE